MIKILSDSLPTILTILSAVVCVLIINIVCFAINKALTPKSEPDVEPDAISDVPKETKSPLDLPHARFNPILSTKPVPLPSHPNLNHLSTVHAISITKPVMYDVNSYITSKLMTNDFTAISSMLVNVGLLSSKDQNPITRYHSTTSLILRMTDSEWQPIHENSLEITINLIKEAITQNYNNIVITYNYDGVWAYAAGYWDAKNDPVVNNYVNDLEALSHQINIYFSKLTPEHNNDPIVNKLTKNIDKL